MLRQMKFRNEFNPVSYADLIDFGVSEATIADLMKEFGSEPLFPILCPTHDDEHNI